MSMWREGWWLADLLSDDCPSTDLAVELEILRTERETTGDFCASPANFYDHLYNRGLARAADPEQANILNAIPVHI